MRLSRRGSTIPGDREVLAAAQGDYQGLQLPGPPWARSRWRWRLDVLVADGELWVTGNGETRRYPIEDMVMASFATNPQGALRVDFLDGDHLCVKLDDNGTVLETLRSQLWEYEKALLVTGHDAGDGPEVLSDRLAQADALLQEATAMEGGQRERIEARDLMRQSAELRRMALVDALRARRRTMLEGTSPSE